MCKELRKLEKQNTWKLVDLPEGKEVLKGRWVYKKKLNNITNTIKYKSRWVVQGYNQVKYLDYLETFSTIYRPETYRLVFIIAILKGQKILQYDVKNVFVHTDIDQEIYIIPPTGYYNITKVYRLKKALYSLKQALRLWYKHLFTILYNLKYVKFNYNDSTFINTRLQSIILCYIDDILITGDNIK